jgi:UDP:flavonoid glycosyltransferase YjiC (YdhE family)
MLTAYSIDSYRQLDVCGFLQRPIPQYDPPPDLNAFLKAGAPPVYIGFGSIVIENPESLIRTLLGAIKACNVRAVISKGWSNLESIEPDEDVFCIGDCPHGQSQLIRWRCEDLLTGLSEWLFQHVSVAVHHGGAGTTACGLKNALPTVIIPFFGE